MKIFIFDLDGTLLKNDKTISLTTIACLKSLHQKGYLIGYVTARTKRKLQELLTDLPCNFIASYDGAMIDVYIDDKEINIANECICDEVAHKIISDLSGIEGMDVFSYFEPYHVMNDKVSTIGMCNIERYDNTTKMLFSGCQRIRGRIKNSPIESLKLPKFSDVYMYFENADVVYRNVGVNKGKAVNIILEYYGINREDAVCFGDSEPDIDMFKECGISVAMGNANDFVKKCATRVTGSNEDNGIVSAIEKLIGEGCKSEKFD